MTWSDDQVRSWKATDRTADMNVLKKSDRAVAPVTDGTIEVVSEGNWKLFTP